MAQQHIPAPFSPSYAKGTLIASISCKCPCSPPSHKRPSTLHDIASLYTTIPTITSDPERKSASTAAGDSDASGKRLHRHRPLRCYRHRPIQGRPHRPPPSLHLSLMHNRPPKNLHGRTRETGWTRRLGSRLASTSSATRLYRSRLRLLPCALTLGSGWTTYPRCSHRHRHRSPCVFHPDVPWPCGQSNLRRIIDVAAVKYYAETEF